MTLVSPNRIPAAMRNGGVIVSARTDKVGLGLPPREARLPLSAFDAIDTHRQIQGQSGTSISRSSDAEEFECDWH